MLLGLYLSSLLRLNSRCWCLLFCEIVVREVSLHYACMRLLDGQLTSALVPTVPFPCFLRQSTTITKVRETFLCVISPYPLRDRLVVGGQQSGWPWLGPGLVRVECASTGLFRQFFTIARTRETLWHLIHPYPRRSS